MASSSIPDSLRKHEIPGRVAVTSGNGGLPKINITSSASAAEIYLHGAHITGFQKNGEPPLLFVSHKSWFAPRRPRARFRTHPVLGLG
jgi:glucose-6-phosphate 1-epimerase